MSKCRQDEQTHVGVEQFRVELTLNLNGSAPRQVVACDEHGYGRSQAVPSSGQANAFTIVLDPTSPYHVIMR